MQNCNTALRSKPNRLVITVLFQTDLGQLAERKEKSGMLLDVVLNNYQIPQP
jgi:hypothetical protein